MGKCTQNERRLQERMTPRMADAQVTYELKNYQKKLNFEIDRLKVQLDFAQKKLQQAHSDVYVCLAAVLLPPCAATVLDYLHNHHPLFKLLSLLSYLVWLLWSALLPFTSYAFIKSMLTKKKNRDSPKFTWQKPALRRVPAKSPPEAEPSYLSEQKKLLYVLGRYYLYLERLAQLLNRAAEGDDALTLEAARAELQAMPFYEDIKPPNPFKGTLQNKAFIYTFLMVAAGAALLLFPNSFRGLGFTGSWECFIRSIVLLLFLVIFFCLDRI